MALPAGSSPVPRGADEALSTRAKVRMKKRKEGLSEHMKRFEGNAFQQSSEQSVVERTMEQLSHHRLLARECCEEFRASVAQVAKTVVFKTRKAAVDDNSDDDDDATVIKEGTGAGAGMWFILLEGSLRLKLHGMHVYWVYPGDCFGEASALGKSDFALFSAVLRQGESHVLCVSKKDLGLLLQVFPKEGAWLQNRARAEQITVTAKCVNDLLAFKSHPNRAKFAEDIVKISHFHDQFEHGDNVITVDDRFVQRVKKAVEADGESAKLNKNAGVLAAPSIDPGTAGAQKSSISFEGDGSTSTLKQSDTQRLEMREEGITSDFDSESQVSNTMSIRRPSGQVPGEENLPSDLAFQPETPGEPSDAGQNGSPRTLDPRHLGPTADSRASVLVPEFAGALEPVEEEPRLEEEEHFEEKQAAAADDAPGGVRQVAMRFPQKPATPQAPLEVKLESQSGFLLYRGTVAVSVGRIEVEQYTSRARTGCTRSLSSLGPSEYGLLRVAECRTCVVTALGPVETWWVDAADYAAVVGRYQKENVAEKEKDDNAAASREDPASPSQHLSDARDDKEADENDGKAPGGKEQECKEKPKTAETAKNQPGISMHKIPIFNGCNDRFIYLIGLGLEQEIFFFSEHIVREGTLGDSMFILTRGRLHVYIQNKKVAELNSGASIGELAVLGVWPSRSATLVAATRCEVQVLHRRVLLTALQEFPTESLRFKQLADERAATITRSASVKRIQAMADLEFFKGSAPGFLQLLERQVEERAYMAGQELMVEGEEGSTLYVLLSGEVSVLVGGVPVNKPKDDMPIFGEGSILTSAPRTATVTATTLCSVKLLHKQVLLDAFDRFPEERAKLEQHMFRRKRELAASLHRRKSVDKFTGSTLQQCEHFRQCPLHILAELAAQANSFVFHHADEIVTEDQAASNSDYLMILQRGVALATSRGVKVGELKQNSTWCEDVVLEVSNKHLSTVRAMTTCVVQLIPGQAVRDALEYDDEEHERLFNVAISMRKTVMLLTMAERGIDAAEALRIAGGAGGFKKKQDQANQDKEDPNKTGHRFRKIQRAKKFLDRAKNAHAQGDAPQAHAKASTQKAANAKSAGGKISAALQSMKALTGLKLGSQGGPALLRGTALMNLMKESHGEPSATGEMRQQNEAAPDSSDEEERSRGVTSLSTSLTTVRALKRLRSTNKDPQAGQASGRKETSELLKSKSFCREMDLQRKNGEVFFMDLPVRGTTVREVEREREQNLILRAAIDYSKRDTVNPAPSYERRYNESSHRVFVLSQTCLSAGDLLKGTMRDVNRTVMRRRSQSPLQLPPLVSAVPAEDRAGLTPESFSDPDS